MKGVDDVNVWENALIELRDRVRSVRDSNDEIFKRLRFSFDRLDSLEVKNCFLYCSFFPEDYAFSRRELIECWIDEGLIGGSPSREAAYKRGHAIIDRLQKNFLLEKDDRLVELAGYLEDIPGAKMHDVVRDMAIISIGPEFGYMIKAGMNLVELPDEHGWVKDPKKLSIMENNILKMLSLKVLDLSGTAIETIPNSISELKNLSTLRLQLCKKLKYLPSLANLKGLKKLDLHRAGIEVLPQGMEMLISLEYLDLLFCPNLKEIQTGILLNLSSLQYLAICFWRETTIVRNFEEVARLKKLETLECNFDDIQDLNYVVNKFKDFQRAIACSLLVGNATDILRRIKPKLAFTDSKIREEGIVLPEKLEDLWINRLKIKNMGSSLSKIALLEKAIELRIGDISFCKEIKCVVELDSSSSSSSSLRCPVFDKLEQLRLVGLPRLCELVRVEGEATPPHVFSNLKELLVGRCSGIRKLLPLELLQTLQNLEVITIFSCHQMQEIIASLNSDASSSDKFTFTFPKLRKLCLWDLFQLKSICSAKGVMVCNSIEKIEIRGCLKLKRIPVQLPQLDNGQPSPPPHLKEIEIGARSKEWWESVEWDHPNAKNVLQPFLKYEELQTTNVKPRATSITRANKSISTVPSFLPQRKQLGILEEKEMDVSEMETLSGYILEDKDIPSLCSLASSNQ
ncbi:hypothetical protein SLEP1_g40342 [Rubroshorea leprosula]|uniref:Uncharacterized protein n=1 Tax=Rubroshorea leprosula TaxID=152421 RepID=A0AAV5L3A1_9ROSI|nr:hypothetical protein SLEP1_g40342 [Rubroshorea leprosula]